MEKTEMEIDARRFSEKELADKLAPSGPLDVAFSLVAAVRDKLPPIFSPPQSNQ